MRPHLLHGLSGVSVTLFCVALFSVRHRTPGLSGTGAGENSTRLGALALTEVYIAVKTTQSFHRSRLQLLLDTWISRARKQTYIFTDGEDQTLQERLGSHLVVTNCSAEHSHPALSCKMAAEFDAFLASGLSWFCHLDDDNYLNPEALLTLLSSFSPNWDVYVGKPSLNRPIKASEPMPNNQMKVTAKVESPKDKEDGIGRRRVWQVQCQETKRLKSRVSDALEASTILVCYRWSWFLYQPKIGQEDGAMGQWPQFPEHLHKDPTT